MPTDTRPILAIVTGHLTPYRIALHKRIASEMPEVRLATLVTKYRTGPWVNPDVPEIGTVRFDTEPSPGAEGSMITDRGGRSLLAHLLHELRTAAKVRRWLKMHRPAAIVCGGYDELPVLGALHWADRRRVPAFLFADSNIHGDHTRGWKRRVKNLYVPFVCARYAGILVCGTAGKKFFHRYGVQDSRLYVSPYEPDYALFRDLPEPRVEATASRLQLDPDRRRLVCCCRLIPVKRVDMVIDAFAAIAGERPQWDLLIVGKGDSQAELERRAGELCSSRRVRFLGFQDTVDVAAIYRRSHALVLASDYEPWALVVNEAAAAGMAIVASDRVGAACELVRDGVNGYVFPAGDLERLIACLRDVTREDEIDSMRSASLGEIERWRREADPIAGLRAALRGVIG